MILTLSINEAADRLPDLVAGLRPDDKIVLTRDGRSLASIVPEPVRREPRQAGLWAGVLEIVDENDEGDAEIAEMFKDYMP